MIDPVDAAYFAGVNSEPFDKNPYPPGSDEALEWNIGRTDAPYFNPTIPPPVDIIALAVIAVMVIIAVVGSIKSVL